MPSLTDGLRRLVTAACLLALLLTVTPLPGAGS